MKRKSNKSVCFSALGERNTYWYTFEVSKEGEDDRIIVPCRCDCGCPCAKRFRHDTTTKGTPFLSPTKVLPQKDRDDPGWTVVGNQLYRLGGTIMEKSYKNTRTVRALDLTRNTTTEKSNDSGGKWQRKPRMLAPKIEPHTVVVGGKLYVLGWKIDDDDRNAPWGEVYDPATNTWEALPRPPKTLKYKFFCAGLEADNDGEKGSIVIFSVLDKILLEYNVATKSWNVSKLQKGFGDRLRDQDPSGPAVAVGRMLYWFCRYSCRLYGLHLDSHMLHKSELVVDVPRYGREPMLGHLGGHKFFLLHPNYDDCYVVDDRDDYLSDDDSDGHYERPKTTLIHCLKFSVGLVAGSKKMNISVESSQSFVIKNGLMLNGCVVM